MLIEEILRKPDEGGNGEDFSLTAGAASGLATIVLSIERALREIGHRLEETSGAGQRLQAETRQAIAALLAVLTPILERQTAASAPEEQTDAPTP